MWCGHVQVQHRQGRSGTKVWIVNMKNEDEDDFFFFDRSEEKQIYSYLNYRRNEEKQNYSFLNYQRNETNQSICAADAAFRAGQLKVAILRWLRFHKKEGLYQEEEITARKRAEVM